MPTRDLRALVNTAQDEIARRAADEAPDFEALSRRALQELFSDSGVDGPKAVAAGVFALGGMVREQSAGSNRHKCQLFTVMTDDDATEMWAWDDALETLLHSDTAKVGPTRRSVSLHAAMDRMVILRHRMTSDGTRHSRTSVSAWRISEVDEEGNIFFEALRGWVPTTLPPPHGGAGSAPPAGRLVRRQS